MFPSNLARTRDDYYRQSHLLTFRHPIIDKKYEMYLCRQKMNKFFIVIFSIILLSLTPIMVQIRALMGHLGVFWSIYTVLNIFGLILFFARVVLEFFYDTIERMDYSRRMFYYNAKSYIAIIFLINHSIAIGMALIFKADNLCDVDFSTYDTIYCNISQVHGMPMDTFVVIIFLMLLYQITLPVKYIYTFFVQIVQFIAVILAGWKVFKHNSTTPMIVVCLALYIGVGAAQYCIQSIIQSNFILKDGIEMSKGNTKHTLSACKGS